MAERQNYNTKARQYILEYLETQREKTVSASDIVTYLKGKGASVNQATVYRYLNRLGEERKVLKFVDDDSQKAVYQFVGHNKACDEHLHIKCVKCGKLVHLECDFMDEIRDHLKRQHDFTLQCESSILYGVCSKCKKK